MLRMPPKEQYVSCKDGNCIVSVEFKAIGDTTSCFKEDLISLLKSDSFKRSDMLQTVHDKKLYRPDRHKLGVYRDD